MSGGQGGNFWQGFSSGALSSLASSLYGGSGFKNAEGNFIQQTRGLNGIIGGGDFGTIAFGTVIGGAGAELSGGNFWQGAATGLIVSGLNHAMHSGDNSDDNGYDKNGKQINNNGGDITDYRYNDNGNIISSTSVEFKGAIPSSGELRGYGFKGFPMATGAITEDNSFVGGYVGGKVIGLGLSAVSKSNVIGKFAFSNKITGGTSSLFGRGKLGSFEGNMNGVLNRNPQIRVGWSWDNATKTHMFQFRTGGMYGAKHYNPFFTYKP